MSLGVSTEGRVMSNQTTLSQAKENVGEIAVSFISGLIFGVGLILSGMTQANKVIGFLDILGSWDPTLMFVMGGALGLHFFTYRWVRNRYPKPILVTQWQVPTKVQLTPALFLGTFLFGIGWGLAGLCPGPAFVNLGSGNRHIWVFVVFLLLGQGAFYLLDKAWKINR